MEFTDYAIGNGVIISTATGSSGYYSYPQRIGPGATPAHRAQFTNNKLGFVILPRILCYELKMDIDFQNTAKQKFNIQSLCNLKLN